MPEDDGPGPGAVVVPPGETTPGAVVSLDGLSTAEVDERRRRGQVNVEPRSPSRTVSSGCATPSSARMDGCSRRTCGPA